MRLLDVVLVGALVGAGSPLSGCSDCSRTIVFYVTTTGQGAPVGGVSIAADCEDVDGTHREGNGTSDADGLSLFRVVAPSRACPAEATMIASYFRACTLTLSAAGWQSMTLTLSGAELDALHPPKPTPDGNRVLLTIDLQPG